MKTQKTVYVCSECDYQSAKWLGRCPSCGAWNTMTEETYEAPVAEQKKGAGRQNMLVRAGETAEPVLLGDENSSHKKLDDLRARVELAKEYENAIFISVHMNKFPVPKYSGLCVYFSKKTAGSPALAEEVRMTVAASLQKENGRQIKGAGSEIYVLYNAPCTAILVECGFLSNPSELAMLKTEEYQSKIAACIFTGAANYMSKTITEEVN